MAARRRAAVDRPEWVLAQVVAGWVHRDLDFHYRVAGHAPETRDGRPLDDRCTTVVEQLADDGLVTEHRDGRVTPTPKGEQQHARNQAGAGLTGRARTDAMLTAGLTPAFQPAVNR